MEFTGIKDIDNIILKYLTQLSMSDTLNELNRDIEIYEKYIKVRTKLKKFSYIQIKSLFSKSQSEKITNNSKEYCLIHFYTRPILYAKPKFMLLKNGWTEIEKDVLINIFLNNGYNNLID